LTRLEKKPMLSWDDNDKRAYAQAMKQVKAQKPQGPAAGPIGRPGLVKESPLGLVSSPSFAGDLQAGKCPFTGCGRPSSKPLDRYKGFCAVHYGELFSLNLVESSKRVLIEEKDVLSAGDDDKSNVNLKIVALGLPRLTAPTDFLTIGGLAVYIGAAIIDPQTERPWQEALGTLRKAAHESKAPAGGEGEEDILRFLMETLYHTKIANLVCVCPHTPCPVFTLRAFWGTSLLFRV